MKEHGIRRAALIAAAGLILDQGTKALLSDAHFTLIPGVLAINSTLNTGLALGLLPGGVWTALGLSLAVLGIFSVMLIRYRLTGASLVGAALVISGALGNLIDRVFLSHVRDMFELLFVQFYIFNIADVCVTAGAVLLAFSIFFREKEWNKR